MWTLSPLFHPQFRNYSYTLCSERSLILLFGDSYDVSLSAAGSPGVCQTRDNYVHTLVHRALIQRLRWIETRLFKKPLFSDFGRVEEGRWRYIRGYLYCHYHGPVWVWLRSYRSRVWTVPQQGPDLQSRRAFENKPCHLQRLRLLWGGQMKHRAKFTFMTGCGGEEKRSHFEEPNGIESFWWVGGCMHDFIRLQW